MGYPTGCAHLIRQGPWLVVSFLVDWVVDQSADSISELDRIYPDVCHLKFWLCEVVFVGYPTGCTLTPTQAIQTCRCCLLFDFMINEVVCLLYCICNRLQDAGPHWVCSSHLAT